MLGAIRIAVAEFLVGFSRRSTGAPGARDFASLAAFFALMSFLILLSWSARDGLWGRFEQLLLGALPEGRAPVRISFHIDNVNRIDAELLDAFQSRFPEFRIVPHRFEEHAASGPVTMPGMEGSGISGAAPGQSETEPSLSWGRSRTDRRETPLRLEAHPISSPLWSWITKQSRASPTPDPNRNGLVIALNRHLFREHFRYDAYRASLLANPLVPCDLRRRLPATLPSIDALEFLVMEVKENALVDKDQRSTIASFQPFRIIWVDSFPTPDQTAMIMPLSTYELLYASARRLHLDMVPEAIGGASPTRFAQLKLADIDIETEGAEQFRKFARCVGAAPVGMDAKAPSVAADDVCSPVAATPAERIQIGSCEMLRARGQIRAPRLLDNGQDLVICTGEHRRLRAAEVAACASLAGLPPIDRAGQWLENRLVASAAPAPMSVEWLAPSRIALPCAALDLSDIEHAARLSGHSAERHRAWIAPCSSARGANRTDDARRLPGELNLLGYQDATVYLAPGHSLSLDAMTSMLLGWQTGIETTKGVQKVPAFRLEPTYESALKRFGVLSLILEKVSLPLAAGGLVLYVVLTAIILATAFGHRRRQYGLLLATGIRPRTVARIVDLQILLSCVFGGMLGYAAYAVTVKLIDSLLLGSAVIADARMVIGFDVDTLLPTIGWSVSLALWAMMAAIAILTGNVLLWMQGVTRARSPIQLIKS